MANILLSVLVDMDQTGNLVEIGQYCKRVRGDWWQTIRNQVSTPLGVVTLAS